MKSAAEGILPRSESGVQPSLAFIMCTEPGLLEHKSLLLAKSIRAFGGALARTPIYSYQPRGGGRLARRTERAFEQLEVAHVAENLNRAAPQYGMGNKVFACAHAEKSLREDVLCFLDSDTLVLEEPGELQISREAAALRPVDLKIIGSEGPRDPHDGYWRRLYKICGVRSEYFVTTTLDRKRVRAYWNAGVVVARRERGLYGRWRTNLLKVLRTGLCAGNRLTFEDQTTLAATVSGSLREDEIGALSERYNVPVHMTRQRRYRRRLSGISSPVVIHYHSVLDGIRWKQRLRKAGLSEAALDWIGENRWLHARRWPFASLRRRARPRARGRGPRRGSGVAAAQA